MVESGLIEISTEVKHNQRSYKKKI
jgi:hypothetical protein